MFTGIVQETGSVRGREAAGKAVRFTIQAPRTAPRLAVGDSVACDGVCLTVERGDATSFSVCAVPETLARTTLGEWRPGTRVNLEPALTPSTPLGGHFVLGHADGTCTVAAVRELGSGEGRELHLVIPAEFRRYFAYKGSVTLSGVSLTVAALEEDGIRIAVIPHTLSATTLGDVKAGDTLNFEADVLAKYVERIAAGRREDGGLREDALRGWGYAV